jgi:hypothetical protein
LLFFKSTFYLEMYQNYFFYFSKIIFDISASKWSENKKKIIWSKEKNKKNLNFKKSDFETKNKLKLD